MTWWNPISWFRKSRPKETEDVRPVKDYAPPDVVRKYDQFRAAFVRGDDDECNRIRAIMRKSGYPIPASVADADKWIARYGHRQPE